MTTNQPKISSSTLNKEFPNFHEVRHPLIQHKLTMLRSRHTTKKEFQELVTEISTLLACEVTKELPMTQRLVKTPLESCQMPVLAGKKPVIMAILRAGLGMVEGFLKLMPAARVAHIGLERDEVTLTPKLYYFKIPPQSAARQFYVCDPMLATGGSAVAALAKIKAAGIKKLCFVCLLAAPEGVRNLCQAHPDVPVFTAQLDRELNSQGYILPGLGDAGDRIFGTK